MKKFKFLFFTFLFIITLFFSSLLARSYNIPSEPQQRLKNQNDLEKKITSTFVDKQKQEKFYSEIIDSFTHKNQSLYLVKLVTDKSWFEKIYLISTLKKKKFWSNEIEEKILWKKRLNSYGTIVKKLKFKKNNEQLMIYTVTTTHKGHPSLELYQLSISDFKKKTKLEIIKNMKPNNTLTIQKIKEEMKKLDKQFHLQKFKTIGDE